MKIYKSIYHLYLNCDKRIKFQEYLNYVFTVQNRVNQKPFYLNQYFFQKYIFNELLKRYKEEKYITYTEYIFAILYKIFFYFAKLLNFIIKDKKYFIIKKQNMTHSNIYTVTLGIDRLIPPLRKEIKNITVYNKKIKLSLKNKLYFILKSIIYQNEPYIEAQKSIFKKSIEKYRLYNYKFVFEECANINQQILFYLLTQKNKNIDITIRNIIVEPILFNGANSVYITNNIVYNTLKINMNLKYIPLIVKTVNQEYKALKKDNLKIAYFSDIGNMILNFKDKLSMDQSVVSLAKEKLYNISITISVHPSDENLNYYKSFIHKRVKIREKSSTMINFLENNDIFIGWFSTALYEAFIYGKPVIILDLFGDKQNKKFLTAKNTYGMVQTAKSYDDILKYIDFFISLDPIDVKNRYKKAYRDLNITIEKANR